MTTTKRTISNISYNTPEYFASKVQSLVEAQKIDWCYWILHEPDTDETKPHIHFVLHPSKSISTMDLQDYFREFDPDHPNKPRTCTAKFMFTSSMDDWLLYAVHDIAYLASKGQVRNYTYHFSDLQATDTDALNADWHAIDRTKYDRLTVIASAVRNNVPFFELVQTGYIPIAQRAQYEYQYNDLYRAMMSADGGRKLPHEEEDDTPLGPMRVVNPSTGEVFEF